MNSFSVSFEPAQACRKRGLIRGNVLYWGWLLPAVAARASPLPMGWPSLVCAGRVGQGR